MKIKTIILFIFSTIFFWNVSAQTKVQVVTKNINKQFEYDRSQELVINGERAHVIISTHAVKAINCELNFISKHPDIDIAKREIDYHKWIVRETGKTIQIRNYIEVPEGKKRPEGNLKVVLEIKVPENCKIDLNNYFGKVDVIGFSGEIEIHSEFTSTTLTDISADVDVIAKFSDITADDITGIVVIHSNRSDLFLSNLKGTYHLDVTSAEVNVSEGFQVDQFSLESEKSDVQFILQQPQEYQYEVKTKNTETDIPTWMEIVDKISKKGEVGYRYIKNTSKPHIIISTEQGSLRIQGHSNANR